MTLSKIFRRAAIKKSNAHGRKQKPRLWGPRYYKCVLEPFYDRLLRPTI